jgi:dUTPase
MAYDTLTKRAKYQREWLKKNKHRLQEYRKRADLKKSYNITLEQFNDMLVEQGGVCYICHEPETQVHPKSGLPINCQWIIVIQQEKFVDYFVIDVIVD